MPLFIIIVVIAISLGRRTAETARTVTAERRDVVQDVTFTGKLAAQSSAELGFEITGSVTDVYVTVGQTVASGDELVRIDTRAAALQLAAATATLTASQDQTKLAWDNTEQTWQDTKTTNAETVAKRRQAVLDAKTELDQAKEVWLQTERENGDSATSETALKTFRAAETAYNAAQQVLTEAIASTKQGAQTARAAADEARAKYFATIQPASRVSGLSTLQADEALANLQFTKGTLRAPFAGVVTSVAVDPGDLAVAANPIITVQTVDQVELTADVSETDAVRLTTGQSATVTFDAKPPTETWEATIIRVAPAASFIEGVPTYETTLQLIGDRDQLKPGLTANITVHADTHHNVIAIPRRAIIRHGQEQFVRLLGTDGYLGEHPVTTGLVGSDGSIEVTGGLSGGEQVVIETP